MSYIPDLTTLDSGHVAVGWLHPDYPFPNGEVSKQFVAKIKEFAARWGTSIDALGWGAAGGFHTCEFCHAAIGSGTFGEPSSDHLYYVPEMISHYVEQHGYAPPPDFVGAVLVCPLPGTKEYKSVVRPYANHLGS
jgi:hypothetical protein